VVRPGRIGRAAFARTEGVPMLELVRLVTVVAASLRHDDRGANLVEYSLLATLIAIVVVPTIILLGPLVAALYTGVIGGF
jgi:pilus assembly protein Flp/PilA